MPRWQTLSGWAPVRLVYLAFGLVGALTSRFRAGRGIAILTGTWLRIISIVIGVVGLALVGADAVGWLPWVGGAGTRARDYLSNITEEESAPMAIITDAASSAPSSIGEREYIAPTPLPIPTPTPRSHVVQPGESLLEIAAEYGVNLDVIAAANDLWDPNRLRAKQVLIIPPPGYVAQPAAEEKPGELRMWWPAQGEITTYFGDEEGYYLGGAHSGIDLAVDVGVPVHAAAAGKVVVAWKRPDNVGWHIVIDHGNGYSTLYGHLSRFFVEEGDSVKRGQLIGSAGNTGFSLGPHLHFEVRRWGSYLDPLKYLP